MPGWRRQPHRRRRSSPWCATSATTSAAPTSAETHEYAKWCAPDSAIYAGLEGRLGHVRQRRRPRLPARASCRSAPRRAPARAELSSPPSSPRADILVRVTASARERPHCCPVTDARPRPPRCSSSAAAPPARRPATGWPATATTSRSSSARRSPARRRAATGSRRGPSTSSTRWASPTALDPFHRYHGLRATGMGRELELQWPSHPVYPSHGYVVRRRELDQMVAENAVAAGATLLQGHEAVRADRRPRLRARRRSCRPTDGATTRDPRQVRRRRRRGEQPLRSRARHVPHPGVAVRHRHPHVLGRRRATPSRGSSRRST